MVSMWRGVRPDNEVTLSLLQKRLNDLGEGIEVGIVFDGEVLTLEAEGPAWINGEPAQRQALKSGDEIRLGEQRFVLQAPGLRPPSVLREVQEKPSRSGLWIAVGLAAAAAAACLTPATQLCTLEDTTKALEGCSLERL